MVTTITQNPRRVFADIAREELSVRETSRNQGPGIAKYWTATTYPDGYKNREPYCAAFVCWCIAESERRGKAVGPVPNSAAVREIVRWARKLGNGAVVWQPGDARYSPAVGDLVWWEFGGSQPNHIGIVTGPDGPGRINTIEANTNPAGSREGDGVYARRRTLSGVGGFIRLAWQATEA